MAARKPLDIQVPGGEEDVVVAEVVVTDSGALPDISTIDHATLTRPILTAQGWLLPLGGN